MRLLLRTAPLCGSVSVQQHIKYGTYKTKISEYFAEAKLKFAEANNIYFFYFQFQSEKIYVFQEKKNLCVISERKQKLSFTCWSQGENLLLDGLLL